MKKPFLLLTFLLAMSVVGNCYAQAIDSTFIHQADSIRKVGVAFLNKADYTNALIECNKSFGLSEKINYKKGVANALNSIGVIYYNQSDYANALNHYQKSLKIREEIGDKIGIAQSFSNIGLIYKDQGDFAKALEYHNNSLKVQEEIGDKKQIANLLTNIGNIYSYQSDNAEALEYYTQSLKIREVIGDKNGIASSLLNIGVIYKNQGNLSKALEYYTQSLKISEEIGNKSVIGASLNNIGLINFTQGDYAKALEYYTQSLKIKEGIGDKSGIALSLNNIGNVYWYQGNFAKALEYLTQSLKINEETGVKFRIAASLSNISIIYKDQYNYTKALECSNNSLKIQEEIGDKEGIAASLHNIGLVYFLKGNYVKAIEYYTQSLKIQEEIGADKKPGIKWLAKAYTLSDTLPKAKHYAKELVNELNKDIKTNYFTLSDNEKTMYFATMENDFGLYHNFTVNYNNKYVTLSDTAYNIALQNKGLSLKSSTAMRTAILNSKDTSLLKQYDEWIFLKKKIAKMYESGVLAGSTTAADSLENIANEMERQLVKKSTAFSSFDKVRNLDWKQVQKSLKKDEAAIEFVHFINVLEKDTVKRNAVIYAAYIVTKNNTHPQAVQLCTEIDLIKILGNTQGNNLNFVNNVYGTQSQQQTALYEKIWQPLEYHLKGIKNIYYSPDGLLHKISFSAISNGKNSFLCDKYNLNRQSSTGKIALPDNSNYNTSDEVMLIGGVKYNSDTTKTEMWSYLSGTLNEVEQIKKQVKNKTDYFVSSNANEENVKKTISQATILHISTHGFFFPDPEQVREEMKAASAGSATSTSADMKFRGSTNYASWSFVNNKNPLMRSGLVLAGANDVWERNPLAEGEDGILTAQEVSTLDMQKTKLVVLSACETGLGDIKGSEGVYGLQRAFKMAGVKNIIMSLWQVPDKETSEFMITFYKKLTSKNNADVKTAFNETQKEMRKKYDPYFWAAFVLVE